MNFVCPTPHSVSGVFLDKTKNSRTVISLSG
jgi:hypothetical protein